MSDETETKSTELREYGSESENNIDLEKGLGSDEEGEGNESEHDSHNNSEEEEDGDDEEGAELSWKDIQVYSGDGKNCFTS